MPYTLPNSVNAWVLIDPMRNPGTRTATYDLLEDQTANGRDFEPQYDGAPPLTSTAYAVAGGGTETLPEPNTGSGTLKTLGYLPGGTVAVTELTLLTWGRYDAQINTTEALGAGIEGQFSTRVFRTRWTADKLYLAQAGIGYVVPDAPDVDWPQGSGVDTLGGSETAWWAQAVQRKVLTASTCQWTWILVGNLDDGQGCRIFVNEVWEESETLGETGPGEFQDDLSNAAGIVLQEGGSSGREAGGVGLWLSGMPEDTDLALAVVWAAAAFGTEEADCAFNLLVSTEAEELYSALRKHIPEDRVEPAEPILRAAARVYRSLRQSMRNTAALSDRQTAYGRYLDLYAASYGVTRGPAETDASLRERLINFEQGVTQDNLEALLEVIVPGGWEVYPWHEYPLALLADGTDNVQYGFYAGVNRLPCRGGFIVRLTSAPSTALGTLILQEINLRRAGGIPWLIVEVEPYLAVVP